MSKSKLFRLFSLLLAFSLSFTIFGLSVSAAGEDFDSDLSNWTVTNPSYMRVYSPYSISNGVIYRTVFKPIPTNNSFFHSGILYDTTNLVAGSSYTLSFDLLSAAQIRSAGVTNVTDDYYYRGFTQYDGALIIGLGTYDSSGNFTFDSVRGIAIDKNNYTNYFGRNSSITFVMPDAVNSAIGIFWIDSSSTNTSNSDIYFDMGNFTLICNTPDLDALYQSTLDTLRDTRVELGGKIDEGFDGLLSGMGDMFSNLSDSIGGFFSDLGDNISSGLENLGSSLLDGIKGLFVPSDEELSDFKTKLEQLLYDKLGIIWQVSDFFAEFITSICSMLWDNSSTDLDFVFPGIDFTLNGKRYYLWDDTSVDMSFLQTNPVFSAFYGMYKVILIIIFSFALFKYAERTFEEVMRH